MLDRIKHLKVPQKLALVVAVMAIPIVVMVALFVQTTNVLVNSTQAEVTGLEYLTPVMNLYNHVQQHRDSSAGLLSGDPSQGSRVQAIYPQVDADFASIEAIDQKVGQDWGTTTKLNDIKKEWAAIRQRGGSTGLRESMQAHSDLTARVVDLIRQAGDKSNLILDPDLDAYYLMDPIVVQIPRIVESVSSLRALATQGGSRWRTPEERAQGAALANEMQRDFVSLQRSYSVAVATNRSLERSVQPAATAAVGLTQNFIRRFNQAAGAAPAGAKTGEPSKWTPAPVAASISSGELFDAGTQALEGFFKLHDTSSEAMRGLLETRMAGYRRQQMTQIGIGLVALLAISYLAWWITRSITGQVNSITSLFSSIGMGDFNARAQIYSKDELGNMAESLNAMLDNTLSLIQSQEERARIEESIQKLTAEMQEAAHGDLTARAEVSAEMTGAIADSFNKMIDELRGVIAQVQDTTKSVSSAATEVQATTEHLADGSESQAVQIVEASAAVDEMALSIQQVSGNAATAATVADQALVTSKRGAESVNKTIDGMNAIRQQVQQTSKRIKRLGESSQEIGEIVQLIGDIADRTSILALNASIQAAMAGDAGKGFAVVAEEVERLSERSAEATKKIAGLIKAIQSETNEAMAAMEETTREVVGGSTLANEAGKNLGEIENISGQLAELMQQISMAAKQQSRGSDSVAKSMGTISEVTQQTAAGAKQAAVSIRKLATLADDLRSSMDRFRVPKVAA